MSRAAAVLAALTLAVVAPGAMAQAPLIPDPGAREVTVLGPTVVWVSATAGGRQVLMQRVGRAVSRVPGAPPARFYRGIDLGRGFDGRVMLTYQRCARTTRCVVRVDDLHGRRARLRGLRLSRCELTGTPALWRQRVAYGLLCRRAGVLDERRSGVYVKTGGGPPQRLPRPRDAVRFGVAEATSVDLRGRHVAYVLSDIFSYGVIGDVDGGNRRSFLAGASEGDSEESVPGLGLGASATLWTLTLAQHADDPLQSRITRLAGGCRDVEVLESAPGETRHRVSDLAVHHRRLLLVLSGVGIASHAFAPQDACPVVRATTGSRRASRT